MVPAQTRVSSNDNVKPSQQVEVRGAPALLWDMVQRPGVERSREVVIAGPGGTGKSRGIGHWLWWVMNTYPWVRILVVRKTRVSLSESFLKTWEQDVIPQGSQILEGPLRAHRQSYKLETNGAEMAVGGLDNPTRLYSTDWDIIYVQECTELTEDEWERLRRGLRNWKMPIQMLLGDCNPESNRHWLYRRFLDKRTEKLDSRHQDNPKWFSTETKDWTPQGLSYLQNLSRLTGVRKRRLLFGEWVSAEGAVWEEWDETRHIIQRPPGDLLESIGCRWTFGSMDWGYTAAGVLQIWAVDQENRMYLVREVYRQGQQLEWWADKVVKYWTEYRLQAVVADPSRPDAIKLVNDRLNDAGAPRLVRPANNRRTTIGGDLGGLDMVRQKLRIGTDGKPGLVMLAGYLEMRDMDLHEKGLPCSTSEEIPSYVYAVSGDGRLDVEKTDPDCADHGCDAMRYAVTFLWRRDLSEEKEKERSRKITWGDVLGHDEVWDKIRSGD